MKHLAQLLTIIATALCVTSCIKEAPLNDEADIITCWLDRGLMDGEATIYNDSVVLTIKEGADITRLAPLFTLSEGATIEPASGTVRNFTTTQHYTVTSQDRQWTKRYAVTVIDRGTIATDSLLTFTFENIKSKSSAFTSYPVFYETGLPLLGSFEWASGNAGFALTGMGSSDESFPTHQHTGGYEGACVELTTCATGSFGVMAGKPIAAGNLFLGTFDLASALSQPLESTHFGVPITRQPVRLSGYYSYTAGEIYYAADADSDGGLRPVADSGDHCAIYAILFEPTATQPYLTGDQPLSTSNPTIISTAQLPYHATTTTNGWQHFEIDFVMRDGKSIDPAKLARGAYSLALVLSSSAEGDLFNGAIGSCLRADNITITFSTSQQ